MHNFINFQLATGIGPLNVSGRGLIVSWWMTGGLLLRRRCHMSISTGRNRITPLFSSRLAPRLSKLASPSISLIFGQGPRTSRRW